MYPIIRKSIKLIRYNLRPVRAVWENNRGQRALNRLEKHLSIFEKAAPHNLPKPLIVSLTSYPVRYDYLFHTLQCLLTQNIQPDAIVLWVAFEDFQQLPERILKLQENSCFSIKKTGDTRSFKKIIPALAEFPDAFIITADDDTYYAPEWLQKLIANWDGDYKQIVAHKAYMIRCNEKGAFLPYNEWIWNYKGPHKDVKLFPVGIGGVLYPPGSLDNVEALKTDKFMTLCPKSNDIWLYWMGRRQDSVCKSSDYNQLEINWPKSQAESLASTNTGKITGISAYEQQIEAMVKAYGIPF